MINNEKKITDKKNMDKIIIENMDQLSKSMVIDGWCYLLMNLRTAEF